MKVPLSSSHVPTGYIRLQSVIDSCYYFTNLLIVKLSPGVCHLQVYNHTPFTEKEIQSTSQTICNEQISGSFYHIVSLPQRVTHNTNMAPIAVSPENGTSKQSKVDSMHAASSREAMDVEAKFAAHNYHPLPVVFARAKGVDVWDPVCFHSRAPQSFWTDLTSI